MRITRDDFAAAESELSADDLKSIDNSDAVRRADAQFGHRPLHQRGIDQVNHAAKYYGSHEISRAKVRANRAAGYIPPAPTPKPEPLAIIGPSDEYATKVYGDDEADGDVFEGLYNALLYTGMAALLIVEVALIWGMR